MNETIPEQTQNHIYQIILERLPTQVTIIQICQILEKELNITILYQTTKTEETIQYNTPIDETTIQIIYKHNDSLHYKTLKQIQNTIKMNINQSPYKIQGYDVPKALKLYHEQDPEITEILKRDNQNPEYNEIFQNIPSDPEYLQEYIRLVINEKPQILAILFQYYKLNDIIQLPGSKN